MKPAVTVESAAVTPASVAIEAAASAPSAFPVELSAAPAITIPAAAEATPVVAASVVTAPVEPVTVVAVIPGADADEHAINEPIWAVVAVRRASVGVIIIIAVSANWRWAVVNRAANANADYHSLRMRKRRAKEANPEQTGDSQVTHSWTSFSVSGFSPEALRVFLLSDAHW
jgi:hypothetical protein